MYVLTVLITSLLIMQFVGGGGPHACQASHPSLQQQQPGQASKQCEENFVKFWIKCYDLLVLTSQTDFHGQIFVDINTCQDHTYHRGKGGGVVF